jgi:hypothetical protein
MNEQTRPPYLLNSNCNRDGLIEKKIDLEKRFTIRKVAFVIGKQVAMKRRAICFDCVSPEIEIDSFFVSTAVRRNFFFLSHLSFLRQQLKLILKGKEKKLLLIKILLRVDNFAKLAGILSSLIRVCEHSRRGQFPNQILPIF